MKLSLETFYPKDNYLIENSYIITLSNNEISKTLTQRCIESCISVQQPYTLWEGFDGSSGEIEIPEHLKDKEYLKWLKVNHKFMTPSQIGCCLSHMSLWFHCITIDRPIVILEHDAIMVSPFVGMYPFYNAITYLGCREQKYENMPVSPTPIHMQAPDTFIRKIGRAHAYAIDPAIAKSMVSRLLVEGITTMNDEFIHANLFTIVQYGFFAYNEPGQTTIETPVYPF
jgi:hypothetical protein